MLVVTRLMLSMVGADLAIRLPVAAYPYQLKDDEKAQKINHPQQAPNRIAVISIDTHALNCYACRRGAYL